MDNLDSMDFNQIFHERTKKLSIAIIKVLSVLPYSDDISIIMKQVIRSSKIAANDRTKSEKKIC